MLLNLLAATRMALMIKMLLNLPKNQHLSTCLRSKAVLVFPKTLRCILITCHSNNNRLLHTKITLHSSNVVDIRCPHKLACHSNMRIKHRQRIQNTKRIERVFHTDTRLYNVEEPLLRASGPRPRKLCFPIIGVVVSFILGFVHLRRTVPIAAFKTTNKNLISYSRFPLIIYKLAEEWSRNTHDS